MVDEKNLGPSSTGRLAQPKGIRRFFWYLKLYFLISSQYVKARLSYRADFFISALGMVLTILPGLFGLFIIFESIPNLVGWSLPELVFLYSFSLLALCPTQIIFDNIWSLRNKVQDGSFIKYYFKPLNMLFYYVSEVVDLKGFAQLAVGLALFAWSANEVHFSWTLVNSLGLLLLLFSSSLVFVGLMVAAASTTFWIVNSFSVLNLASKMRDYARYPINIYSSAFKIIFSTLIPIGFISYYPVQWLIKPTESGMEVWLTPLIGIVFYAIGAAVWSRGVRRWGGTGT